MKSEIGANNEVFQHSFDFDGNQSEIPEGGHQQLTKANLEAAIANMGNRDSIKVPGQLIAEPDQTKKSGYHFMFLDTLSEQAEKVFGSKTAWSSLSEDEQVRAQDILVPKAEPVQDLGSIDKIPEQPTRPAYDDDESEDRGYEIDDWGRINYK